MSTKSYADLLEGINQISTFDLFRLVSVIDRKLEDADRILEVKRSLKVGQVVQYFVPEENRVALGKLLKLKRRTALVEDQETNRQWDVIYPAIDLTPAKVKPYLDGVQLKNSDLFFRLGDDVQFLDRHQVALTGKIIALNQKTATVVCKGTQWRIAYDKLTGIDSDEQVLREPVRRETTTTVAEDYREVVVSRKEPALDT